MSIRTQSLRPHIPKITAKQAASQDAAGRRIKGLAVAADLAGQEKERDIQRAIMLRLSLAGWVVVRINSNAMRKGKDYVPSYIVQGLGASAGVPDVIAFRGAEGGEPSGTVRSLLLEVKDARGKLTDTQERFIEFAKRHSVTVHVVRSVADVEDLL